MSKERNFLFYKLFFCFKGLNGLYLTTDYKCIEIEYFRGLSDDGKLILKKELINIKYNKGCHYR